MPCPGIRVTQDSDKSAGILDDGRQECVGDKFNDRREVSTTTR